MLMSCDGRKFRFTWIGMLVVLSGLFTGCSDRPATYPAQGTVRFSDGTAVQFGEIETFHAETKLNSRGSIRKDGTFELGTFTETDGVVAGKHKVVITQYSASPMSGNVKFDTVEHRHGHELSDKYRSYATSELEFEMVPGETKSISLEINDYRPGKTGHQ